MSILSGPPTNDSVIQLDDQDPQRQSPFYMAQAWIRWILDVLIPALQLAVQTKATKTYTGQHATITAASLGVLTSGTYLVSYYARITSPDGVSSSLTVTIGWTESGQALSVSGSAMVGDSLTTVQTGTTLVILDPSSTITIGAVYASNTPNKMLFRLKVVALLVA